MKWLENDPLAVICLSLCVVAIAVTGFVTVSANHSPDTIQACYNNTNGQLRRVSSQRDCRTNETAIRWNSAGPPGPQGPPGPPGPASSNITAFRHTHSAANECGPPLMTFSIVDHPSLNGKPNALVFVTALMGINAARTATNPNSNLQVVYTGSSAFGSCPAGRWIISGGDITVGAQFDVMIVVP